MSLVDPYTELEQADARVRRAVHDPDGVQTALLREVLHVNRDTDYGRRYEFASIDDLATYRARVPLMSSAVLATYVERMIAGERDVLFEGHATFFGCTSGTTSAPKRIGFNPRVRDEYIHMSAPVVAMLERDFPGASRSTLMLTATYEESHTASGIPLGNASGFLRRALGEHPFFRFSPEVVYESLDPDARNYTHLMLALQRPMRCFAALMPVLLVNLMRRATEVADALVDDLASGRMEAGPPGIRALAAHCAPRLRPNPEAARRLRDIVRTHGRFVPGEYWPDVAVLQVWKGGTAKHALGELHEMFPRAQIRPLSSGSTEASLMSALDPAWNGGIPCLLSTVIEYLPADAEVDPANVVTLRDLERDRGYRLVVTNHRGLYRYVMEDVFVIEGYHEGIPYLNLEHRLGIVSNLTGEKVTEEQVAHAIDRAIAASGVHPRAFQVAPEKLPSGIGATFRYVVQVELAAPTPTPDALRAFITTFENDLRAHNSLYLLFRNGLLGPAILRQVRAGHFERVLRARTAGRGRADAQYKQTALSMDLVERDEANVILEVEVPPDAIA